MGSSYGFIDLLILLVTIFLFLCFYSTRKFYYWKKKNVPFVRPIPLFGNAFRLFTFRENIGEFAKKIYQSTTEPFIGFFVCDEPYLLFRDPELVKNILVKDFNIFYDRSIHDNIRDDPMGSYLLFLLKNPDWRDMRKKITPIFTSGKLKNMFMLIRESGQEMINFLKSESEKNSVIDIREVSAKYTTDAVSSTAFGINANCFKSKTSEFRDVSRRVFNWAIWERAISTSCYFVAPNIIKFFRLKFIDKASSDFLRTAFWKTMEERQKRKIVRNDVIDVLNEIKDHESIDDTNKLEGDKLVALATQFFVAGFETTSSTISFTLYEFAVNKEVQDICRKEIQEVAKKHGEISYNALKEMEYLDMCIKETLRKYPPLPQLDRRCNQDYKIPGTDIILDKGTPVFIAIWAFHLDPKYFPEPDKYDPTRFTEENIAKRPPFTYLPFGEGPRNCIGARFGIVSSKTAVAQIISQFEVELCDQTQHPLKLQPKGVLLSPLNEIYLKFRKI